MSHRATFRRILGMDRLESREVLSAGGPSAEAQYMIELINMARTNPSQAANVITSNLDADVQATIKYFNVDLQSVKNDIASSTPVPPLAWNDQIASAALGHSQDMANTGVQSHTGSNGSTIENRLDQAGYTNRLSGGEDAYAYSTSAGEAIQAFLIDWGVADHGHRNNILQPGASNDQLYHDIGIGIVNTNKANFGPKVVTVDFGHQTNEKAQLVGVAYNDNNHDGLYSMGEGAGNVEIDATNLSTGQTKTTYTWDAGGYQIPLDPGTYNVTAKVGNQVVRSQTISINDQNVKVDYNLSQPWQAPAAQTVTAPTPVAAPVVAAPTPAPAAPTNSSPFSWLSSWSSWTARKSS